jgi:AraC-like DNA-binding protein
MIFTNTFYRNTQTTPIGRVKMAGFLNKSRSLVFESMRVLGSYALVYLLEGGGVYYDANHYKQRLRAGDLLLLFPELAHSYGPRRGDLWSELYVVFDGPAFDLWREVGLLTPQRPVLHLEPIDAWSQKLGFLFLSQPAAAEPNSEAARVSAVCRLISALTEAVTENGAAACTEPVTQEWLGRACWMLEADLGNALRLTEVAARLGLSYESFRKRFQQATGVAPARYRTAKRIEAARALLEHTRMTNKEIAQSLGFSDAFHFANRFKQSTGVTPRAYRSGQR